MLEPSGRVWCWARARPPDGQSSLTPFVERPSRTTPPLGSFICWAQGRSALKSQKKGLPSCAGRTRRQARTLINNRQGSRTAVFLLFHSHPCRLICDINPGRPRDICGPVSARRSQLSIRSRRCLHRPPPVPALTSIPSLPPSPFTTSGFLSVAVVSLFSAKKVLDHPGGCPSALSSLPRQGGSVADTWLGQLAPGLAVETWSPTAAASPSLHSAPLRLKLLTHPRGANSNPGSPSAATAYYCVASPAQHPPEPPTPRPRQTLRSLSPYLIRPPCRLIGHPLNLLPD